VFCHDIRVINADPNAASKLPRQPAEASEADAKTGDLAGLRNYLLAMIREGAAEDAIDLVLDLVVRLRDDNNAKAVRIAKMLRERFGRRTEKVSKEQLELFLQSVSEEDRKATDDDDLPPLPKVPERRSRPRKRTGRNALPADLPREVHELHPGQAERVCERCGQDKKCLGHEASEVLDFVPAKLVVHEYRRFKYACDGCEDGVVIAEPANKPVERGRAGPGLLARVVTAKYVDHLPLYRQSKQFARLGVPLADSTLMLWVAHVATMVKPLYRRLVEQTLAAEVLGVDDTHIRVLDKSKSPAVKRGFLWAYIGYEAGRPAALCYDYTPNRKGVGPCEFMGDRIGYVQGDGYTGMNEFFAEDDRRIRVGCMTHSRRKFKEALDAGELRAAVPLKFFRRLYEVERLAREQGLDPPARQQLREEHARPVMARLHGWLAENRGTFRPSSKLGGACGYAINQWSTLTVYLDDGRIPIDNNLVENRIRPIAIGRKNWLFAGSDAGGERAAILYTVLGSAMLCGHEPFAYLRDVIDRIAQGWRQARLDELLPSRWSPDLGDPGQMPPVN